MHSSRYHVSLPLVAATHLEALLTNPDISCKETENLVEERKLVELMKKEKVEASVKKVETRILSLMDGEDIPRLLLTYNILAKLGSRGQREFSIPGILDESQLHFFSLDHEK